MTILKKVILFLVLVLLMPPLTAAEQPDKCAVIVSYDNRGECRIFASTCARLFKSVLLDNGFSNKDILWLNGNKANHDNVIEALNSLKNKQGTIVVGFFGHGGATYVALKGLVVLHEEIRDIMVDFQSEKQLVVIDTCKSGGAILPGQDGVTLSAPNRIVLTATESEIASSTFTGHLTDWSRAVLLYGLKDGMADLNGDGRVSVEEAGSLKGGISDNYEGEFFL